MSNLDKEAKRLVRENQELGEPDNGRPDEIPEPAPKKDTPKRSRFITGAEYVDFLKNAGYEFALCELDDFLYVNNERMTDSKEAEIKTRLRDAGYHKVVAAADACLANALKNSFHPIRDYLKSLSWDGQDHIGKLAGYFTDKYDHFPLILRKWMIGAVARPMTGGKQNRVMVLEGKQDIGKSSFAEWLSTGGGIGAGYFTEAPPNPDNKDSRLALATMWIWELKELGSITKRADREALKGWLTTQHINERVPYGKYPIHKPAITSFIATVNDEGSGFLSDPTGSRRYMTCIITDINWDYSKEIDADQVWAQAYDLFTNGADWNLTPDEKIAIEAVNEEFEFTPPVHDWLNLHIDFQTDGLTQPLNLLAALRANGLAGSDVIIYRQVAAWMKKRGIEQKRVRIATAGAETPGKQNPKKKLARCYPGVKIKGL